MFAAIKRIPKKNREPIISAIIKDLGLGAFEHILAGTYSGGNKWKLSVAIA